MLCEFIATNGDEIIRRCRAKGSERSFLPPTAPHIDHGASLFLDQLGDALRLDLIYSPEIDKSAVQHGHDVLNQGLSVSHVVHDYGDICQAITELALELDAPISTDDFRMLNRALDDAVASAVTQYTHERSQASVDGETARASERLGFFAHELLNLADTAIAAFEVLKAGNIRVAGTTANVLHRSLIGLRVLIGRSLAEVRLTQAVQNREHFLVSGFLADIASAAAVVTNARGIRLVALPVEEGVTIEADREILAAVVENLLQNAIKFARPHTTVVLRALSSSGRVLIEVENECDGLTCGNEQASLHLFEQRTVDRSCLGLGLAFSRWGAEANRGRIHVRNVPGHGCIFTVDLPQFAVPSVEPPGRPV
jgi:signal transduction histidine kinase